MTGLKITADLIKRADENGMTVKEYRDTLNRGIPRLIDAADAGINHAKALREIYNSNPGLAETRTKQYDDQGFWVGMTILGAVVGMPVAMATTPAIGIAAGVAGAGLALTTFFRKCAALDADINEDLAQYGSEVSHPAASVKASQPSPA